jgi:hypothetical protein
MVNFVLCVTYFPAIVVIWNKMGWEDASNGIRKKVSTQSGDDKQYTASSGDDQVQPVDKQDAPSGPNEEKRHWLQAFCSDKFAPTLFQSPKRAVLVLAACLALTGGGAGLASQLRPSEKDFRAESFPATSNTMRFFSMQNRFSTSSQAVAYLAFVVGAGDDGTKAIDRTGVDPNNPRETGSAVFYEPVPDFSSTAAQNHLLRICDAWAENKLVQSARFKGDPRENGVRCFVHHFRDWVEDLNNGTAGSFPVPPADFVDLLARFTAMPSNTTCHDAAKVAPSSSMFAECSAYYRTIWAYPSAFREPGRLQWAWESQVRWATSSKSVAQPQVKQDEMSPECTCIASDCSSLFSPLHRPSPIRVPAYSPPPPPSHTHTHTHTH